MSNSPRYAFRASCPGEVPAMAGPGDEIAAGGGHLRAAHADREQVIGTLKAAFVHGMLDKDEFGQRLGQALASRTYADLAVVTADLPAGLADARPHRHAGRAKARQPMSKAAKAGICAALAIAVPVVLSFATGAPIPLFIFPIFYLMLLTIEVGARWSEKHWRAASTRRGRPAIPSPPAGRPGRAASSSQLW
jgi:hypothetical protein